MKKIFNIIFAAGIISSCSTDLDQRPILESELGNLSNVQTYLNGAYVQMKVAANEDFSFGEIRSDNSEDNGEEPWQSFNEFDSGLLGNVLIQNYWDGLYKAISIANISLVNLDLELDLEARDDIEGQAKFLRALAYFKLVRVYGDVPLNTASVVSPDDSETLSRKPVADVYSQIISDLNDAQNLLFDTSSTGKPTSYAAKALLGKVNLYLENYTAAITLFEEVINSGNYSLLPSYADVFSEDNELNDEVIYATQYDGAADNDDAENSFSEDMTGVKSVNNPTEDDDQLADGFSTVFAGDTRLEVSLSNDNSGADATCVKYGVQSLNSDIIEIRYSDVLLMYAEALNENGSADFATTLGLLDGIRLRGGQVVLDETIYNTQELVREAIKKERRIELAFENHRWHDLVRWGDAVEVMEIDDLNFLLFPIPTSEVNATGGSIEQNPGY